MLSKNNFLKFFFFLRFLFKLVKLYLLKQAGHLWCSLGLHSRRHALGMYSTVLLNQGLALGFFPTQGFSNHC